MEIKVRPVEVKDVFTIAKMLGKVTKGSRQEIADALKTKKDEKNPVEFALVIFQSILVEAEADLKAWFADLIGEKIEVFEALPATTVIDIIDELAGQEGIRSFFTRASLLGSKRLHSQKPST